MQHLALDLAKKESQVCIRSADGTVLSEGKVANSRLKRYFRDQPPSRVIVETCAEAFAVADLAIAAKHEVRVVPATLVRSLGVGSRGVKTDVRDARVLSEVSCRIDLPSVHVPSDLARQRRSTCQSRETLVAGRTALINRVRGWARTELLRLPSCEPNVFPERVRQTAQKHQAGLPEHIEQQLVVITAMNEQVRLADKELAALTKDDALCQRLMSIPGVGPVTSLRFVAALDDVARFPNAHAVQSFLGLTPGENSSSDRRQRTGITKAGPAQARWALVQAAWSFRRVRPNDPIAAWALEIEKRRGKFVATVAVARKLAGVMYAIWRDGSSYDPHHTRQRDTK